MTFRSVPRPSSPPGAKASTECPYRAQYQTHFIEACLLSPCTGTIASENTTQPCCMTSLYSAQFYPTPLNPAEIIRGTTLDPLASTTIPSGQTVTHDFDGPLPHDPASRANAPTPRPQPSCPARPGAHQNLIHNTKEQNAPDQTRTTLPAHSTAPRSRGRIKCTKRKPPVKTCQT